MNIVITLFFYALGIFFLYGALNNFLARGNLRQTYRQWGYPDGFHYVTAALEFIAAVLLFIPGTRLFGAALAAAIMLAAIATLLKAGLRKQSLMPGVVLAFSTIGVAVAYRTVT
ncbi:DoxX family protein [Endobacterium cereale]|uniref:DoxX family protein n=1 Tax=Endobacterium cereale TaxID=2663029 RepID=UPI002B482DED|nr:DoxX family protein [Endobacterium cereale]MEB2848037.1 DoxX family protein [Endobacterium cereale]